MHGRKADEDKARKRGMSESKSREKRNEGRMIKR